MSLSERILNILKELKDNAAEEIEGSIVVRSDGLVVSSLLPKGVEEKKIGSMVASIARSSERVCDELKSGEFTQVIVEGSNGKLVLSKTKRAFLGALVKKDANIGLVLIGMEKAKELLENELR